VKYIIWNNIRVDENRCCCWH